MMMKKKLKSNQLQAHIKGLRKRDLELLHSLVKSHNEVTRNKKQEKILQNQRQCFQVKKVKLMKLSCASNLLSSEYSFATCFEIYHI